MKLKQKIFLNKRGEKRPLIVVVLLLFLLLCMSSLVVTGTVILIIHIIQLICLPAEHMPAAKRPISSISSAIDGTYQYKSTAEILDELKSKQVNAEVSVLPSATFPSGIKGSTGSCMIQTETTSKVSIQAEFSVNGKTVGITPLIQPGQHVESVTLNSDIQSGVYNATVFLNCYDLYTHKFLSKADVGITITVK